MWVHQDIFNQPLRLLERSSSGCIKWKAGVEQLLKGEHRSVLSPDPGSSRWGEQEVALGLLFARNCIKLHDGLPRSALAQNSCLTSKKKTQNPITAGKLPMKWKNWKKNYTGGQQNKSRELNDVYTVAIKLTQISFQPSKKQPNPNPANPLRHPKKPKTPPLFYLRIY